MPALRLRSEPLRQQFEAAPTKRLLFSLFPLTVWTEELRLDLVSTGFALFFLMAQYDAKTHGYLGGLVALAVGCYAWTKSAGAGGVATPQQHRR